LKKIKSTNRNYEPPSLVELGSAKDIINSVFTVGSGDTFPGTDVSDELASGNPAP
jgi:hypothetical protein